MFYLAYGIENETARHLSGEVSEILLHFAKEGLGIPIVDTYRTICQRLRENSRRF